MSFHRTRRALARSLTIVPAALLLHIGAALAADSPQSLRQPDAQRSTPPVNSTADAQEFARRLLLGITAAPPTPQPAGRGGKSTGDAQEFARDLLLGITTRTTQPQTEGSKTNGPRVHGDAQALAREVLVGRRDASAGS